MSVGFHVGCALIGLLLVLWHGSTSDRAEPPRVPAEPEVVEATTLEPEPGSVEVDALGGGRKAADVAAPSPAPEPEAPAEPKAEPKAELKAEPAPNPVEAEPGQEPQGVPGGPVEASHAPPPAAPSSASRSSEKAFAVRGPDEGVPAGVAGAAASGDAAGDGGSGPGDAGHARSAPSVAPRFTKELAAYAAHVPGWEEAPLGATATVEITIELDGDGHVVRSRDPVLGVASPDALLTESARRTVKALLVVLSLPGHPVGAGTVVMRVQGTVSDREPPRDADPNGIAYAFQFEGKSGAAWFTLASGRHVEITVEVLRVESM